MAKVIARTSMSTRIRRIAKRLSRIHETPIVVFSDVYEGGVHMRTLDVMMNRENGSFGDFLFWNWVDTSPVKRYHGWQKVPPRTYEFKRK